VGNLAPGHGNDAQDPLRLIAHPFETEEQSVADVLRQPSVASLRRGEKLLDEERVSLG
jgi:hypothetical protein